MDLNSNQSLCLILLDDGTADVWRLSTSQRISTVSARSSAITAAAFSTTQASEIATGYRDGVLLVHAIYETGLESTVTHDSEVGYSR